MKVMTYTKARNNLRALIDQVIDSSEETIITSREEGREVVVMPLADYNGWTTTNHLLSTTENSRRLEESIRELHNGETVQRDLIDG